MALEAQGVKIFWSTSTGFSTAQEVNQVTNFNGPTGSANVIDITHLGSTAKEKLMGLPDEGQVTFDVNFLSTDAGQIALQADRRSRTKRKVAIGLTDTASSIFQGDGFVTGFSITGAVDDKLTASVTIEIDGPLTFTTN